MNRKKILHQKQEELKKKEEEVFNLLPRSVRWRLHLNLLTHPRAIYDEALSIHNEKDYDSSCDASETLPDTALEDLSQMKGKSYMYLAKVEEANQSLIAQQRTRYENLSREHYWSCSPLAIIGDTKTAPNTQSIEKRKNGRKSFGDLTRELDSQDFNSSREDIRSRRKSSSFMDIIEMRAALDAQEYSTKSKLTEKSNAMKLDSNSEKNFQDDQIKNEEKKDILGSEMKRTPSDPLSMLALMEETNVEKQKRSELEYKRQKARMQRYASHVRHRENLNDEVAPTPVAAITDTGGACAGSRWSDFYSSREVLSVIEKDLNRLPPDHHLCYHYMKQKHDENYVFVNETSEEDSFKIPFPVESGGHRGMASKQSAIHNGNPNSHNSEFAEIFELMESMNQDDDSVKRSREERSNKLSEILFVYAKEHPALGYRQGMHEILSLVYLCLELDMFLDKKKQAETKDNTNEDSKTSYSDAQFSRSHLRSVLDYNKLMHDAYTIFEAIMSQLSPGYDVVSTKQSQDKEKKSCSMELMGISILEKIKDVAGDNALYNLMKEINVPPQLYCTRWVRLMFSREVVGWENVMKLWDVFFHLIIFHGQNKQQPVVTLMNVLECTASSMIQLLRQKLLPRSKQNNYENHEFVQSSEEYDPNESINILMNYPPLKDISPLVNNLTSMLAQEQEFKLNRNQKGLRLVSTFVTASSQNLRGVFRRSSEDDMTSLISNEAMTQGTVISSTNTPSHTNQSRNRRKSQDSFDLIEADSKGLKSHRKIPHSNPAKRNFYEPNHRLHPHENPNGFGNAMHNFSRSIRGAWGHLDNTFHNLINDQPGSPSMKHVHSAPDFDINETDSQAEICSVQNSDKNHQWNITNKPNMMKSATPPPSSVTITETSQIGTSVDKVSCNETTINNTTEGISRKIDFDGLASKLDSSVITLVSFLNKSVQDSKDPERFHENFSVSPDVWNALSDIQGVKKELKHHANSESTTKAMF